MELRIDMVREADEGTFSWTYQTFQVAGATDNYRLTIGEGQGPGYDAMLNHNGEQFTTYDNDNDKHLINVNCGYQQQGGWWYHACYRANINGPHESPLLEQSHAKLEWNDGAWHDGSGSYTVIL